MPKYLSPGVYVEEVEAGSRPIEGVGTAVAAFVGFAARGSPQPADAGHELEPVHGRRSAISCRGRTWPCRLRLFQQRRRCCYVVRVGHSNGAAPPRAELTAAAQPSIGAYQVVALEAGGRRRRRSPVEVSVTPSASGDDALKLSVSRGGNGRRGVRRAHDREGRPERREGGERAVEAGPASSSSRCRRGSSRARNGHRNARRPRGPGADRDQPGRLRRQFGRPHGLRRPRGDRRGHDGVACPTRWPRSRRGIARRRGRARPSSSALVAHCELDGRPRRDPRPAAGAERRSRSTSGACRRPSYDSKYAALYWPWIKVFDPRDRQERVRAAERPHGRHLGPHRRHARRAQGAGERGRPRRRSPSRRRSRRASTTCSTPTGSTASARSPGRGIRVWGARTMSSDPSWRYLNVRRLFNYIEESILEGTQWVVFEPNDLDLWARIRRTINAFLLGVWRDGALFGATPEEAFYVKCDAETNPPDVGRRGQSSSVRSASRR